MHSFPARHFEPCADPALIPAPSFRRRCPFQGSRALTADTMFLGRIKDYDAPWGHQWRSSDTFIVSTMGLAMFTGKFTLHRTDEVRWLNNGDL